MARNNYGTLRGGNGGRRGAGGAWQWVVIGFVGGFGCAAVIGLALIILGLDPSGILTASRPTPTALIITATLPPMTPTPEPTEVIIVPTATTGEVALVAPSATPTTDPNTIQVESSPTPTTPAPTAALNQAASNGGTGGAQAAVPRLLEGIISPVRNVDGGTFDMGTSASEVATAVNECVNTYQANCEVAWGEDSAPMHQVTINPFSMEVTEVTYAQYLAFLNSMGPNSHRTGCEGKLCIATRAEDPNSNVIFDSANYRVLDVISDFPVTAVTWYGAKSYCEAIGRRLPTEAEWERAARGPQDKLYPWGNTFATDYAKTSRPKPADPSLAGAVKVGSYPSGASDFGVLDMAGNVAEWVSDWYSPSYYTQLAQTGQAVLNPQGPPAGTEKVVRGGSWDTPPFFSRSVHRQSSEPQNQALWLGFRCAQDGTTDTSGGTGAANTSGTTVNTTPASASTEGDNNSSAPTLPPPPVTGATAAPTAGTTPLATLSAGTLPPG
ncbi:MAG: SUMF1/EgtB/PvdO family nonheme iron enzyme [Chloroflexota bacterium]